MKTTITELRQLITSIVARHPIYGARDTAADLEQKLSHFIPYRDCVGSFYLRWDQGWALGCTLNLTFRAREGHDKRFYTQTIPEVSWSSSGRSLAQATAATVLYTQVIQLAALIEAATDGVELEIEETTPTAPVTP